MRLRRRRPWLRAHPKCDGVTWPKVKRCGGAELCLGLGSKPSAIERSQCRDMGAPRKGEEKLWSRDPIAQQKRAEELRRLYEVEGLGVIAIGKIFGVAHRSVAKRLHRIGVEVRPAGPRLRTTCCEPDCSLPVHRVKHATNGSWYGKRCRLHWIVFRMLVNQRYNDRHLGKDDEAWLRRLRQLLARVQRINREVSRSLSKESSPATTSPAACRR